MWTVFPKLFRWPPFVERRSNALERLALLPLVGGSLFLLFTGVANINLWYPWTFNFRTGHYWVAWITIGALLVHLGAKWSTTRATLARRDPDDADSACAGGRASATRSGPDRRTFLLTVLGASGCLTLFTVGQTVGPLQRLALLAPRRPDTGPQGFPVNRTRPGAGARVRAVTPSTGSWSTAGCRDASTLSLDDLAALPQHEATLPIACVEGWSAHATWHGVRVRDLLHAGAAADAEVTVESLQQRRSYGSSELDPARARRRHAARPGGRRRGAPRRPRVPAPAHRAQPSRRDADEVGDTAGRFVKDVTDEVVDDERPGLGFWIGLALGTPVMVYGAYELVQQMGWSRAFDVAKWLGGGSALHDLVLVPIVLALVWATGRIAPGIVRVPAACRRARERVDRGRGLAGAPRLRRSSRQRDRAPARLRECRTHRAGDPVGSGGDVVGGSGPAKSPAAAHCVIVSPSSARRRSRLCSNSSKTRSWLTGSMSGRPAMLVS